MSYWFGERKGLFLKKEKRNLFNLLGFWNKGDFVYVLDDLVNYIDFYINFIRFFLL